MEQTLGSVADAKAGKPNGNAKGISEQIALLQNDLSGLAKEVTGLTKEKIDQAVTDIQGSAAEKVGDFNSAVRQSPMQATAIAVGVGFVLGLLMTR